jgi:GNAT superfamily N-acetyltransferase
MTPPLTIRGARADEADVLSAVARRAKASWGYPQSWLDQWHEELAFTPAYLREHRVWVAESAGAPAGVLALESRPGGWSIDRLWVDPSAQGLGVGRALVDRALDIARATGGDVDVLSDPHAEAFYLKLGARRAGEEPAPMPDAPNRILPRLIFSL